MKKHILKVDDFKDFVTEVRIAGSHNKEDNKTLDLCVDPVSRNVWFVVRSFKEIVATVSTLETAIEIYNDV